MLVEGWGAQEVSLAGVLVRLAGLLVVSVQEDWDWLAVSVQAVVSVVLVLGAKRAGNPARAVVVLWVVVKRVAWRVVDQSYNWLSGSRGLFHPPRRRRSDRPARCCLGRHACRGWQP